MTDPEQAAVEALAAAICTVEHDGDHPPTHIDRHANRAEYVLAALHEAGWHLSRGEEREALEGIDEAFYIHATSVEHHYTLDHCRAALASQEDPK